MKREIALSNIGLIAATRGMLGTGIGMLVSGRMSKRRRRAVGWTLVGVGALSTIPLAIRVFHRRHAAEAAAE